jgi:hypothetical protein
VLTRPTVTINIQATSTHVNRLNTWHERMSVYTGATCIYKHHISSNIYKHPKLHNIYKAARFIHTDIIGTLPLVKHNSKMLHNSLNSIDN